MLPVQSPRVDSFPKLSVNDFKEIGEFIHSSLGIKMPIEKKGLVESRLRKRLKILQMETYSQYKVFLFSSQGIHEELPHFIDAITTNKTDFFREPQHFDVLVKKAVPELIQRAKQSQLRPDIKVWSAACSRGDEPYTIAMVLQEMAERHPGFDYSILATDISPKMLKTGAKGIYEHSIIDPVPQALRRKYLLMSKDREADLVRIIPPLRKKIQFKQLNLISDFNFNTQFDVIFCRNVTIYFDKPTTDNLMERLCNKLKNGGFLFMGHSELLNHKDLPVVSVASSVYQKVD